jgi:poly-gamma-glutamate capsule biosynthesis protein CapA/YwtB (metallophosphatase superfamily)
MRRAVGALAVAAALAFLVGLAWLLTPSGVPQGPGGLPATDASFSCPAPCDRYSIAFAGDTMIGRAAYKRIKKNGYGYVLEHVPGLLAGADYAIINAEAPITFHKKVFDRSRRWTYRTRPAAGAALAEAGVDALGFANNHTFDRGPKGILDTFEIADEAGLVVFGAGLADRAEAPLLLETPFGTVAVVAFQQLLYGGYEATDDEVGMPLLRRSTVRRMHRRAVAEGADHVVAYVHWGSNYSGINVLQKRGAARLVAAGYDLVIGHGSHVLQPVGILDGVPIVYSLGNFVFNTQGRYGKLDWPGWGAVATAYLGPDGFEGLELTCIQADNQVTKYKPRPCNDEERAGAFEVLGPHVRVRGERGVVTW